MTNHAIIALERVRDELSDDRRGLPRVTRSYQRPAPRSVTPHHSRGHARLLKARSHPAKSSQRNWRKQNQTQSTILCVHRFQKLETRCIGTSKLQAASKNLRRGSVTGQSCCASNKNTSGSPAIMWRKVLVGSLAMASGAVAFAPAAAPALSRAHSGPLLSSCTSPVSRRVQPQPTEIWRAIAGDGKGESAYRVCAERERKKGDRTRVLRRQHSASQRCLCRPA